MSRKYSQAGYMESERDLKPRVVRRAKEPGRPRSPLNSVDKGAGRVETKFHLVTRCNNCAAEFQLDGQIQVTDRCKNCGTDLHTCRNCRNFDPAACNQCMKPVASREAAKNQNNLCNYFEAKVLIEKQGSGAPAPVAASTGGAPRAANPHHQAFHDLFKN